MVIGRSRLCSDTDLIIYLKGRVVMKNSRTKNVIKKLLRLPAVAVLLLAAVMLIVPEGAQAASGDKVIRKSIKAGKEDSSVKLTKDNNTVIYEIDVPKADAELGLSVSVGSVSDRLVFTFYYESENNSPIYRSEIYPESNGKIEKKLYFSVLKKGKHYLSISGAGTTSTTGTITVGTSVGYFDLCDEEDNNTYKKAQNLPLDGETRQGFLCNLAEYGLDSDSCDWYTFTTKSEGFFLCGQVVDNPYASISMELYDGRGSSPELKFTYSLSEPQEKLLKTLPAGKYYVKISGMNSLAQKGFFDNQAIYSLSVAPYKELKGFELSKKKLTLTTKGSTSKATLTPELDPSDAIPRTISWKSSNSKVATVEKGVVKGKKKGTAKITCTITDVAGNTKSQTCTVTVKKK